MVDTPAGGVAPEPGNVEGEAADGSSAGSEAQLAERSVITTGWVSITVDDPIVSAEQAADLAEQAGGRVDSRTESPGTDSQPPSASLTLRIPSDELDAFVDDLRELGAVNSVSMNASDVTQQRNDLDGRIEALTASTDRLQQLLAEATTIADLIAIESELTTRQAELDSLTQQRDWLVDQVDFSTITVDLVTEAVAPDPKPDDFWSGLAAGWKALVELRDLARHRGRRDAAVAAGPARDRCRRHRDRAARDPRRAPPPGRDGAPAAPGTSCGRRSRPGRAGPARGGPSGVV